VSLLGVFGLAMAATQTSQQDMIAKQLANEALESVVTARNTSQISWDDIQNVGSTNCPITFATTCGIFVGNPTTPTFEPIANAGLDGSSGRRMTRARKLLKFGTRWGLRGPGRREDSFDRVYAGQFSSTKRRTRTATRSLRCDSSNHRAVLDDRARLPKPTF